MIDRYNQKDVEQIFSDENKFKLMLEIHKFLFLNKEYFNNSDYSRDRIIEIFNNIKIDIDRIRELEQQTRHETIAFNKSVEEQLDTTLARQLHFGLTSSDLLDTSLMLQIDSAISLINDEINLLLNSIELFYKNNSKTIICGRTHGQLAEPISLGRKFYNFYDEINSISYWNNSLPGKLSGPVGNNFSFSKQIETDVLRVISNGRLYPSNTTQVIPRDVIVEIIIVGARLATALERMTQEIRHLSRTEIGELSEGFKEGQTGSSSMPHKKNPIGSENISGVARIIRSHVQISLENCLLWNERDISHSSSERIMIPEHFNLLVYMIRRTKSIIDNLQVNHEQIQKNLEHNEIYSSIVFDYLLKNVDKNFTRNFIYRELQKEFNNKQNTFDQIINNLNVTFGININLTKEKCLEMVKECF